MKNDAKKVLISMIDKSLRATDVLRDKEEERVNKLRNDAFLKAIGKDIGSYIVISDLDDGYVTLNTTPAGDKLGERIVKDFPYVHDTQTEAVTFNALNHTIYVSKGQIKKYEKLAEEIDIAIVSGEAKDIYELLKKALG